MCQPTQRIKCQTEEGESIQIFSIDLCLGKLCFSRTISDLWARTKCLYFSRFALIRILEEPEGITWIIESDDGPTQTQTWPNQFDNLATFLSIVKRHAEDPAIKAEPIFYQTIMPLVTGVTEALKRLFQFDLDSRVWQLAFDGEDGALGAYQYIKG